MSGSIHNPGSFPEIRLPVVTGEVCPEPANLMSELKLFGFPQDALQDGPAAITPVTLLEEALSEEVPVVLYHTAAAAYRKAADAYLEEVGWLPIAVLFLGPDAEPPSWAWKYFKDTIRHAGGSWDVEIMRIEEHLCVLEASSDVPESFFQELDQPVEAFGKDELPISTSVASLLSRSREAYARFLSHMQSRFAMHRRFVAPPVGDLLDFVQGRLDAFDQRRVGRYLERSPIAQAEVALLRALQRDSRTASFLKARHSR